MPSTRKQKAREKRTRQSDVRSDLENVNIMLGSYSRNVETNGYNDSDINQDSESNRLQRNSNLVGEDSGPLPNTTSRENSEITMGTTRMISDEITNKSQ